MDHKNHDNGGMGMMWMMMIGCMVPLLLLSLFGRGSSSLPRWVIPVAIVVMFGLHYFVMRHHHGKRPDQAPKADVHEAHDHQPPNEQKPRSGV